MRLCEISAVLLLLLSSRAIHVTAQSQRRGARRFQTPNAELVSDEDRTFESRQSRDSASLNWSPRPTVSRQLLDNQESAEPLDSSRGFNQLDRRKGSSHFDLESNLSYDALKTSQQKSTLTTNSDRYKNERPPAFPRKRVETTDSLPSPTPRQESKYPRRGKLFSPETFSTRQPETSPTSESSFQSRQRSPGSNSEQTDGSSSRRGRQRSRGESAKSLYKDLNANVEEDKDTSIQESDNYPGVYKQLKNQGISTFEIQEKLKLEAAAKKSKNDGRHFNSVTASNLPSRNRETEINRNILPDPKTNQRPSQLDFGKTRAGQTSTQTPEADHVTQKVSTFRGSVYGRFRPEGSFKSTSPSPEIPRDFATEEPIDARNNLQRSKQAFQPRRPITTRPRDQFSPRPRQSSGQDATHQSTTERTTVNAVESYRISARQKAQRTEDSTAESNQKTTGGDTRGTFKSPRVPPGDGQKEIPGARIDREKYFRKPTRNFSRLNSDKENVSPTKDESEVPNPRDFRPPLDRETSIEPKKERETPSKKYKAPYRGGRLGQIPEPKEESAQTQAPPPILGMRSPIRTLNDGELVPLEEYYDTRSPEGRKNGGDPAGRRLPSRYPPKRSFAEMVASLNAELGNRTTTVKAPFKPKTSSRPPGEEDQENAVDDDPLDFSSPDGFSLSGSELKEVSLESASLKGDSSNNSESSNIQFIDSKPITNITSSTKDEVSNNGTNPSLDTLPLANVKLGEKSQLVMDMIEAAKLTGEFETDPNVLANKIIELAIERAKNMQKNSNDNQKLVESNRIGKSLENSMKTEGMATEEFKSEVDNSTLNMLLNNEDRAKLSQAEILNAILSSPDILGPNANQITSYEKKTTKKPKKKKSTTTTAAPLRLLGLLGNLRNPPRQTSSSDFGDFDENDQPDATSDFGMDDTYGRPMNEGLLGAVLEVTRAMSRLMATVVQGATRSLRNFLRQRTRSLTDFLASGSAG